jgi:hypothetical protein
MESPREMDEISCPWCGAFSRPDATCELCGSPMSDGHEARVTEGVTILTSEPAPERERWSTQPPVPAAQTAVVVEQVAEPIRFIAPDPEPLLAASSGGIQPRAHHPVAWVRYRRSLQVRWLIEAVSS